MALPTKVIVTNCSALNGKYGAGGWTAVAAAVGELIVADAGHGIITTLVAIDDATAMSAFDTTPVGASVDTTTDAAAAKRCVDAIVTRAAPDYVLLLGAPDVVPQPLLANPLWTGNDADDPDEQVPSDLPYACDAASGTSIAAFRGPTRVVGRLPDVLGATDPSVMLTLLRAATRWTSTPPTTQPTTPPTTPVGGVELLAISTLTWRSSTQTSVAALGGAAGPVHTCPNDGPAWTKAQLDVPLLFVNCHGAALDPTWYGEQFAHQPALPHAIDAAALRGNVRSGCVIAAECCYGAMHWDPRLGLGQPSVALTFLAEGASGVFGSSTMSYGPAVGNGTADVITRMFLEAVAGGASLGRAALTARQRYVAAAGTLAPTDLKTLAQFDLLGDPSVHPVATQPAGRPPGWAPPSGPTFAAPTGATGASSEAAHLAGPPPAQPSGPPAAPPSRPPPGVGQRRAMLTAIGTALQTGVGATLDAPRALPGLTGAQVAELSGLDPGTNAVRTFDVDRAGDEAYHVTFASPPGAPASSSLVVVRSETGQAPDVRTLERK